MGKGAKGHRKRDGGPPNFPFALSPLSLPLEPCRGTQIRHHAVSAPGLSGNADLAAVKNQQVGKQRPGALREQLHQRLLDLHRISLSRETQTKAQAGNVSVDHDSFVFRKSIPEYDIRRFSPNPGESTQFLHRIRNFPGVL